MQELCIASTTSDPRRIMPPILPSYRRILDVGSGAGQTLIAAELDPATTAIGLDINLSALTLGRQLDPNIHFVCGKGEALPFQSENLDFVFSRVALPYMHMQTSLSEIRRVLRVGGSIWLVLHPGSTVVKDFLANLLRLKIKRAIYCLYVMVNGVALNCLRTELHLPFRPLHYESFQTVGGIKRLLREVGFDEIHAEKNDFFVATAKKTQSNAVITDNHADLAKRRPNRRSSSVGISLLSVSKKPLESM